LVKSLTLPPMWPHIQLGNCTCQLMFRPTVVGSPSVVHFCIELKLKNARVNALLGLLKVGENQVRNICSSARDWKPRSLVSKPGKKRWYTLWNRVMPPPSSLT